MKTFNKTIDAKNELRQGIKKRSPLKIIDAIFDTANEKMGFSGRDHMLNMPLDVQRDMTSKIKSREVIEVERAEVERIKERFGVDRNSDIVKENRRWFQERTEDNKAKLEVVRRETNGLER